MVHEKKCKRAVHKFLDSDINAATLGGASGRAVDRLARIGRGTRLIVDTTGHGEARPNAALIKLIARAHVFAQRQHGKDLPSVAGLDPKSSSEHRNHSTEDVALACVLSLNTDPRSAYARARSRTATTLDRDNRRITRDHAVP